MRTIFILFSLLIATLSNAQQKVYVKDDATGKKLVVDNKDFLVNGMNWDYFPIGTNYAYSLWKQPESVIKAALDYEMPLLKNMGVNAIRQYTGVPPKWIKYIYENYGIYTMLNHSFGRYGLTIDGAWLATTHYDESRVRELLLREVKELAETYKNTPGVLLYLLGNENNYGLFWQGAETEDFPDDEEEKKFIGEKRGRPMYNLMNEAAKSMKSIDNSHPVAICNGDVLFIDIIAEECKDVDIFGTNTYRGASFGDIFQVVKNKLNKPVLLTEFGADAYNAITNEEDQRAQAKYLVHNWKDIYENASGMGKAGNAIGGFTFQFSDGWWKFGQTKNLDVHDNNASWVNGGYLDDYQKGENNMNEEWFGICAKGPTNEKGLYELYPRAAYYALKDVHAYNPYNHSSSINSHFDNISVVNADLKARGDKASLETSQLRKISLSTFRADISTFSTGGSLITTPKVADPSKSMYPNKLGFDHMQSFYVGVDANPTSNVRANVQFNVLGHVAENPIDEIFYENRGRPIEVVTPTGTETISSNNRIQLYRASFNWNHKLFDLNGFYRTGHYHWGYEGDFFGLYPEANYGPNIDIYNGEAPFGFEIDGKKALKGLKVAFGPELWWGANPAVLLKYSKHIGKINFTGIYHEDLAQRSGSQSSYAIPQPKTRRVSLALERKFGKLGLNLGGLWAGQPLNGRDFQILRGEEGNYSIYQDQIKSQDNFGGKIKLTYAGGKLKWYGQAALMGLVANGGADLTRTFAGWQLKDNGSGNQYYFLSGFALNLGNFQIAPNFMWQKPLEGPIPLGVPAPGRPRNILDDPFSVRINREMVAGELLLSYDPTPGTWMFDWDNDMAEDAKFAISHNFIYRHLPTTQDAGIGISTNGRSIFAFPGAPPPKDLWESNTRIVSKLNPNFGFIANMYFGNAQANGSDPRLIERFGLDLRALYKNTKFMAAVKVNDWGPYDYHRDFNLTYPLQLMADFSTGVGVPNWFILPSTRIGIRGTYRTMDQYSPRYSPILTVDGTGVFVPDPKAIGFPNGNEWEIRTYIQFNIGK